MCSCKHPIKQHKYNKEFKSYDECKECDCEGFDPTTTDIDELYLGTSE